MTKDLEQKETPSSSFREKMLREMEDLKQQRLSDQSVLPEQESAGYQIDEEALIEQLELHATQDVELVEMEAPEDMDVTMVHTYTPETSVARDEQVLGDTRVISSRTSQEELTMSRSHRSNHRQQQERVARRIVTAVVVLILLTLSITGYMGYAYVKSSLEPMKAGSTQVVQVEIPYGSTTKDIGNILVKNGLIKNATIFNYYVKLKSYNNFQGGFYNFNKGMSVDDLAKALQEGGSDVAQEPIAGKVLIVEGYTLEQIADAVTKNTYSQDKKAKTPFSKEAFLQTVQNPEFIARMVNTYPNLLSSLPAADSGVKYQLEGYLFPATYDYTDNTTVEGLVEQMLAATDSRLQSYYANLPSKGLDVNQLLTLASLVEKEGSTDEDRRNIASVFYNRLNIDMPLQSNIAILYAMGKLGQKTTLAEDAAIDTNIDSPYNIYVRTGLMPGPVASPSLSAIEATLGPNKTDYYYFVADVQTGTVYYSVTAEEHNQKVEQYVNSQLD